MIAPGAVTHATDLAQREVQLAAVTDPTGGAMVVIPNDGTLPPGRYMLFAITAAGVPSVAKWFTVT